MTSKIESMIVDNFGGMPLWVRVLVYLTLVLSYLSMMMGPKFIDGELIVRTEDGSEFPLASSDQTVRMSSSGRWIVVVPALEGNWAMPVSLTSLIKGITLQVEVDDGGNSAVTVPISNILFDDVIKIHYSEDDSPKAQLLNVGFASKFSVISSAKAQSWPENDSEQLSLTIAQVEEGVLEILAGLAKEPMDKKQLKQFYDSVIYTSTRKRSIFVGMLKRDYGIQIHRRELTKIDSYNRLMEIFADRYK